MLEFSDKRNANGSAVARLTADVLLLMMHASAPIGISELARRAGSSKSAVHRVVQSLTSRGFLEQTSNRSYRLGHAAAALGARALAHSELEAVSAPTLMGLRDVTGETVLLSRPVAGGRMYVAQYESTQEVRLTFQLGVFRPWHAGASGKAMLAYLDDDARERILRQEAVVYGIQERRLAEIRDDLADVRVKGYAESAGELNPLAAAVAAPIFEADKRPMASISISGPVARFPSTSLQFAALVLEAAHKISVHLGTRS